MAVKRTNKAGLATRTAILDAANRLFSTHGYRATSLSDILEALSLTKGAFYHHFKSKEDLALELLRQAEAEYETRLFKPALSEKGPAARLSALLRRLVELNSDPQWCHCLLLLRLTVESEPAGDRVRQAVKNAHANALARWTTLIETGQAAGEVSRKWPAQVLAQLILAVFWGALHARQAESQVVAVEQVVAILEDILVK